jgi:hypothetical protein
LANRAYDNNDLRQTIAGMVAEAVIPLNAIEKAADSNAATYKLRNSIERCFNKTQVLPNVRDPLRPPRRSLY